MKTGEAIIKLLNRYDFTREIPSDVREKMLLSRKRIHKEIMNKRCGGTAHEYRGEGMNKFSMLLASAAAVVVIAAGMVLFKSGGFIGRETIDEALTARAVFISGNVSVRNEKGAVPLKNGDLVSKGDTVITGAESYASLQVDELGVIKINAQTECAFNDISAGGLTELKLVEGSVYSSLKKLGKDQSYRVKTPTYTASVRGTEFLTSAGKDGQNVKVLEGVVNVSSASASSDVTAQRGVNVSADGLIKEYTLSETEILKLRMESLFPYVENLKNTDQQKLDLLMKDINDKMVLMNTELAELEGTTGEDTKLSPLDRLRKMNRPLTMVYLRDGSQIAGSVTGQKNGKMKIDTGDGVIEIPVSDVVKRMPLK